MAEESRRIGRRKLLVAGVTGALAGGAGCLRLGSDDDGTRAATGTGTTVDYPPGETGTTRRPTTGTDTTTETVPEAPPDYPTGLSPDGVSPVLLDNHALALADTSFTAEYTRTAVGQGRRERDQRVRYDGDWARFADAARGTAAYVAVTAEKYGRVTWRAATDDGRRYGDAAVCCVGDPQFLAYAKRQPWGSFGFPYALFEAASFTVTESGGDGPAFELAADRLVEPAAFRRKVDGDRITDFEASGAVTSEGVVGSLRATVEYVRDGRLDQEEFGFGVSAVGETAVGEPEWLGTARSRAPDLDVTLRDDRVVYEHAGGDPVPAGAAVGVRSHDDDRLAAGGVTSTLSRPFTAGETLVAYVDGGGSVTHDFGGVPDGATVRPLPSEGYTLLDGPARWTYFKQGFVDIR